MSCWARTRPDRPEDWSSLALMSSARPSSCSGCCSTQTSPASRSRCPRSFTAPTIAIGRSPACAAGRMTPSQPAGQPVVYTSRQVERPEGMEELVVARAVSDALVAIVRGIEARPDFVVGKGGITSSDVGTLGSGCRAGDRTRSGASGRARLASRAGESIPGPAVHRLPRQRRRCGDARRDCHGAHRLSALSAGSDRETGF